MSPRPSESPQTTGSAFEPVAANQDNGGLVTRPKGLPGAARTHSERRAGSNSYGDCRACPRNFPLGIDGKVPPHLPEERRYPGDTQVCSGSNQDAWVSFEPKPKGD